MWRSPLGSQWQDTLPNTTSVDCSDVGLNCRVYLSVPSLNTPTPINVRGSLRSIDYGSLRRSICTKRKRSSLKYIKNNTLILNWTLKIKREAEEERSNENWGRIRFKNLFSIMKNIKWNIFSDYWLMFYLIAHF